jgi:hypothetical protein
MKWKHWLIFILVFTLALWLWPNLVHEQLHRVALKLQGIDGKIHYDFSIPAHPSITKQGEIRGIVGGLLFVLLPSLVSVLALIGLHLLLPRVDWGDWEIGAHGLILYIVFDLIENILRFQGSISDFKFLIAIPGGKLIVLISTIALSFWALIIVWQSRDVWWEDG